MKKKRNSVKNRRERENEERMRKREEKGSRDIDKEMKFYK